MAVDFLDAGKGTLPLRAALLERDDAADVGGESLFHEAVADTFESDDGEATVGGEAGEDGVDGIEKRLQFAVDAHTESLENAGGGVMFAGAGGGAESLFDDRYEGSGGRDGGLGTGANDGGGDDSGGGFFAECKEKVGQFGFGKVGNEVGGGFSVGRIHSHIERAVVSEAKTAESLIELFGRDAGIDQGTVDRSEAILIANGSGMGMVCVNQSNR